VALGFFFLIPSVQRMTEQCWFMLLESVTIISKIESSVKLGFCVFISIPRERDTNSQYKKGRDCDLVKKCN